jgi:hypothetical protein
LEGPRALIGGSAGRECRSRRSGFRGFDAARRDRAAAAVRHSRPRERDRPRRPLRRPVRARQPRASRGRRRCPPRHRSCDASRLPHNPEVPGFKSCPRYKKRRRSAALSGSPGRASVCPQIRGQAGDDAGWRSSREFEDGQGQPAVLGSGAAACSHRRPGNAPSPISRRVLYGCAGHAQSERSFRSSCSVAGSR